jgi:hypothetical protein
MEVWMLERTGVLDQPCSMVTMGSAPKPLLFEMVLHAKSCDFLRGPSKLGLKYVGCPNHRLPTLGIVFVYSVGPKEGLSW